MTQDIIKVRIQIGGGVVQGISATGPVNIQFVDHDFPDGHNATYDGMPAVTWWEDIPQSACITEEQFALGLTYNKEN